MQVEVSTDRNVEGTGELIGRLKAEVHEDLSRFRERLTRVEVHLATKTLASGASGKHGTLEARPAGQPDRRSYQDYRRWMPVLSNSKPQAGSCCPNHPENGSGVRSPSAPLRVSEPAV